MFSVFQVNYVFCISGELSVLLNFNLLVLYCLVTTLITFSVKEKDGSMTLKKTHDYWHQIQGQLHLSGTHCCDLVVWTLVDLKIVRILKDSSWAQNISTMLDFFFSKFQNLCQNDDTHCFTLYHTNMKISLSSSILVFCILGKVLYSFSFTGLFT